MYEHTPTPVGIDRNGIAEHGTDLVLLWSNSYSSANEMHCVWELVKNREFIVIMIVNAERNENWYIFNAVLKCH